MKTTSHPNIKEYWMAFALSINAYAQEQYDQVLIKKLFPVTPKDMLTY